MYRAPAIPNESLIIASKLLNLSQQNNLLVPFPSFLIFPTAPNNLQFGRNLWPPRLSLSTSTNRVWIESYLHLQSHSLFFFFEQKSLLSHCKTHRFIPWMDVESLTYYSNKKRRRPALIRESSKNCTVLRTIRVGLGGGTLKASGLSLA